MSLEATTSNMAERAANASPLGKTLKFATAEGCIYLDGAGESNKVSNDDKDADCTVKMELQDLQNLLSGDLNPMTAFMTGKLKVEGDMSVAMKLQSLV